MRQVVVYFWDTTSGCLCVEKVFHDTINRSAEYIKIKFNMRFYYWYELIKNKIKIHLFLLSPYIFFPLLKIFFQFKKIFLKINSNFVN